MHPHHRDQAGPSLWFDGNSELKIIGGKHAGLPQESPVTGEQLLLHGGTICLVVSAEAAWLINVQLLDTATTECAEPKLGWSWQQGGSDDARSVRVADVGDITWMITRYP